MFALLYFVHLSLCFGKKILFVDSSSSTLGTGASLNNPLNNLELAFNQASDDLEIELISSKKPYLISSSFAFPKSIKLFSGVNPMPQLLINQSAFLEFHANVSIKGLMIISNNEYEGSRYNEVLFKFGGNEQYLERELSVK